MIYKWFVRVIIVFLSGLVFTFSAAALGTSTSSSVKFSNNDVISSTSSDKESKFSKNYSDFYKASGADNLKNDLPSDVNGKMKDIGVDPINSSVTAINADKIFSVIVNTLNDKMKAPLKSIACVLAIILLCSLVESLSSGFSDPSINDVFNFVGVIVVAVVILIPLISSATTASNDIKICGYFMLSFVPIYAGILISSGKIATAAGYQTILLTVTEFVVQAASNFIVPLVSMHMAISVASTIPTGINLEGISQSIKKAATYILSIGMTIFIAVLSLQTAITSSSDSATLKAGKFLVGSAVPIVGGNISDALASVQSCMGILRTSVGLYAVIAMLLILLPSLLEVTIWKLSISICVGVAEMFNLKMISSFLKAINASLSILLAIVASCFVLFVIGATIVVVAGGN